MVDLLQVECVEAIMRTGSFRRAANEVYLSQPSVSAHIAKLERELGLTLFQRGSDGTKLTSQGERILPHLRAFTAAATAIRQASDHITVHRTPTLTVYSYRTGLMEIMPPALRVLNESFDPMQARVIEASHADMVAGLVQGKCDLAIDAGINATTGDDPGIDAALLVDIGPTVLIGRHGHPLLDDDGWIDPAEIVNVPIVMPVSLEPFMLPLLPESAGRRLTLAHDPLSTMAIFDAGAELAIVGISLRIVADPNLRRRPIRGAPPRAVHGDDRAGSGPVTAGCRAPQLPHRLGRVPAAEPVDRPRARLVASSLRTCRRRSTVREARAPALGPVAAAVDVARWAMLAR